MEMYWKIFYQPEDFFRRLRQAPQWWIAFSISTSLHIANGVIVFLAARQESAIAPPVSVESVIIGLFILIILRNLILWSSVSFFLHHLFKFCFPMLAHPIHFRDFFVVLISSNLVFALQGILSIAAGQVVWLFGLAPNFKPIETIALSTVVPSSTPMLITLFVRKINPFSLWYLWVLINGVKSFNVLSAGKTLGLVLPAWFFDLYLQISIPRIFQLLLHVLRTLTT